MRKTFVRRLSSLNSDRVRRAVCATFMLASVCVQASLASGLTTYKKDYSWLPFFVNAQVPRKAALTLDVERLRNHDVVLVIDKSQSMAVEDCPPATSDNAVCGPISRWNWCRQQVLGLAQQANWVLPGRFRVVAFSGDYITYDNVDPSGVSMIFSNSVPSGPTCVTRPLQTQLDRFFARRNSMQSTKPLLIAMITDGCPNDAQALRRTIANATQKMSNKDDITIAILQVGHDVRATQNLKDLQNLGTYNAKFDIVNTMAFEQVEKVGLVKALAEVIGGQNHEHISTVSHNPAAL